MQTRSSRSILAVWFLAVVMQMILRTVPGSQAFPTETDESFSTPSSDNSNVHHHHESLSRLLSNIPTRNDFHDWIYHRQLFSSRSSDYHLTFDQVCWLVNVGLIDLSTHNAIQCQCDMKQYTMSCQLVGSKQPECNRPEQEDTDDDDDDDDDGYDDDGLDDDDSQGDDDNADDSSTENIKAYPIHWNNLTCAANIHVTAFFRKNQESNSFFHQPVDRYSVCVNYDYDVLSKECARQVLDTCVQFGYVNSLSNQTDCTVQFASNTSVADGKLQHCQKCHMCGSSGYSIDCSNIREGAVTTGCHVWDAPDKDLFLFLSVRQQNAGSIDNQTTTATTASDENQPNPIVTSTSSLTTTSSSFQFFRMSLTLLVLSIVTSVAMAIIA